MKIFLFWLAVVRVDACGYGAYWLRYGAVTGDLGGLNVKQDRLYEPTARKPWLTVYRAHTGFINIVEYGRFPSFSATLHKKSKFFKKAMSRLKASEADTSLELIPVTPEKY